MSHEIVASKLRKYLKAAEKNHPLVSSITGPDVLLKEQSDSMHLPTLAGTEAFLIPTSEGMTQLQSPHSGNFQLYPRTTTNVSSVQFLSPPLGYTQA